MKLKLLTLAALLLLSCKYPLGEDRIVRPGSPQVVELNVTKEGTLYTFRVINKGPQSVYRIWVQSDEFYRIEIADMLLVGEEATGTYRADDLYYTRTWQLNYFQ